jgi:hypothetical protein
MLTVASIMTSGSIEFVTIANLITHEPYSCNGVELARTCHSIARSQPISLHSICHLLNHASQIAVGIMDPQAVLSNCRACDGIIVANKKILSVVKSCTNEPFRRMLLRSIFHDLGHYQLARSSTPKPREPVSEVRCRRRQ